MVADGVVATNWHVASYYNDIVWEQFPDEITYFKLVALYPAHNSLNGNEFLAQEYEVTGIFGDWSRDIAFLQVETLGRKHLPLTSTRWQNQQILDEVMAMGYPISYDFVATVGRITAILTNEDVGLGWVLYDTKLLKIDSQIDHGNSGGPLLNERGEVIGINFAGVAYATVTHNFALSADYLAVYDLDTLEFQGREVPSPSDYHTQVILDSAYYIDPSGSNYYLLSLKQNCLYKFVATGVDFIDPNPVIPVSTHFDLYRNGWWQTSGYPNMSDVYKSDILYRCDETANYDLNVYVETYFTNYPGWYNLKITEYCPIP
ncbi:MAG: serine protease [Candidatus Parcubacteria bacterium]|nr:serine protease [Candidatus Parcubacteria bacterium]